MDNRIGIIGGGQLGKMIAQEAKRMSMEVIILDPTPDCPAAMVSGQQIVADFKDVQAIYQLARSSDVVTYEIELGDTHALKELQKKGHKIFPSAETLEILQDKLVQKEYLKKHGLPVPEFSDITFSPFDMQDPREQMTEAITQFGFPSLLKLRRDSYDGRGNFTFREANDLSASIQNIPLNEKEPLDKKYLLERYVHFVKEVSVMVARNLSGQVISFPLVENIHQDHILQMTIAPARVSSKVVEEAKRVAVRSVECLNGVGIFGVEMFLSSSGEILINEIAPRPHNSGHYSIEACDHSQFELHLRAILDLPLVEPTLLTPVVMLNILGKEDSDIPYRVDGIRESLSIPGVKLHLYGKKRVKRKRKLGHVTILGSTVEEAIQKAERVKKYIKISTEPTPIPLPN